MRVTDSRVINGNMKSDWLQCVTGLVMSDMLYQELQIISWVTDTSMIVTEYMSDKLCHR